MLGKFSEKTSNVRVTKYFSILGRTGKIGFTKQHFDELKKESVEKFDSIEVDCNCPVKITVTNHKELEAHFYGDAAVKGDVKFNVEQHGNTIRIKVRLNGSFINSKLQLEVSIPNVKNFKKLKVKNSMENIKLFGDFCFVNTVEISNSMGEIVLGGKYKDIEIKNSSEDVFVEGEVKNIIVESDLGNITLNTSYVEKLKLENSSGKSIIRGDFKDIDIKTDLADVKAEIYAESDVQIKLNTSLGKVRFKFENIKEVKVNGSTNENKVYKKSEGYTAYISYKNSIGDIKIK